MMRVNVIAVGLLFVATAAAGRPLAGPRPPIPQNHIPSGHVLLDLAHLHLFHLFHQPSDTSNAAAAAPAADRARDWSQQSGLPDLSMGPLHPEFGPEKNPLSGLSAYQDQLGSSAWKEQENKAHSAKLMFTWPTDR